MVVVMIKVDLVKKTSRTEPPPPPSSSLSTTTVTTEDKDQNRYTPEFWSFGLIFRLTSTRRPADDYDGSAGKRRIQLTIHSNFGSSLKATV